MTLRSARRAARRAYHRAAHLDTFAELPDHEPEECDGLERIDLESGASLDIDAFRLDAIMEAAAPILRRHAIQEHARRYGRRTVQLTVPEQSAVRFAVSEIIEDIGREPNKSRADLQRLQALRRVMAKLDALPS